MKLTEKRAGLLPWEEIALIVSEEIEKSLGIHVSCLADLADGGYWSIAFPDYQMPLSQVYRLLEELDPPDEAWEDALPDEGERSVAGLGMRLPEALMQRNLGIIWRHRLITTEGLWVVDLEDKCDE